MIRIIEDLIGEWRRLDERIDHVTTEIEVLARSNEGCRRWAPWSALQPP